MSGEVGGVDVYAAFIAEVEALTIKADMPAVAVVGELTRAVKRAQMAVDKRAEWRCRSAFPTRLHACGGHPAPPAAGDA